jgi:sigma-B regulation protein RsbU (phosphoserine phosphatase)
MGHGVRAGLLTALIRGVVSELGPRAADPAHVLAEINRSLMPIVEQTGQPVFASAFFGVIDLAAGMLSYGNAGHPPPLVRRAKQGSIERLAPTDPEPATGLIGDFQYTRHECQFDRGDVFLGYTDGVLEATNPQGQMFGEEGLRSVLAKAIGSNGSVLCDSLLKAVEMHSERKVFDDDVCVVVIDSASK